MSTHVKTDLRQFTLQVKSHDVKRRTFEGSLSSSHLDLGNGVEQDIVMPGSFSDFLKAFKRSGEDGYVPLLDSHSPFSVMNVLGHLIEAEERLTGEVLKYETDEGEDFEVEEMYLDAEWQVIDGEDGDRILDRLRSRSVRKMSMGYEAEGERMTLATGPVRLLQKVWVKEGSLVVFPMNPFADVNRVKMIPRDSLVTMRDAIDQALKTEPVVEGEQGDDTEPDLSKWYQLQARRLGIHASTGA